MTFIEYAAIGIAIGIITTAPVGPVNIMAIRHAVQQGFWPAVFVGLGAAAADTIYAAAAVFGVSAVTGFIEGQFNAIGAVGAVVLIVIGVRIMQTHPHLEQEPDRRGTGFWGDATAAFFMVITNPGIVLAYAAIMGSLGPYGPERGDHLGALSMVVGVAVGASCWWALLAAVVTRYACRIDDRWLDRANHIAGIILIVFGLGIGVDVAIKTLG